MSDTQAVHREGGAANPSILVGTKVDYPRDATVHDLFLAAAARWSDHAALEAGGTTMTYAELAERSSALARALVTAGVRPGDLVAIRMRRGIAWVVAMLAALRAGAAYLPLNATDPAKRVAQILGDAKPVLVLTEGALPEGLGGVPALDVHADPAAGAVDLPSGLGPTSPAYVMYTSGSTGQPKGVQVAHRNIVRLVIRAGIFDLSPATRMLQTGAATFDATTYEVWGPLLNGGTLVIPDENVILDPRGLGEAIRTGRITSMWLTAPLFHHLSLQDPRIFGEPLRELIVGGDVVVGDRVGSVLRACPGLRFFNGYGPTENTTFSTVHRVSVEETGGRLPIGRPFASSTAYILDEGGAPVPRGVAGEIYVGGDGVALGYLGRPELTAKVFLDDPFVAGGRMYRTGDLGSMREDGAIEFLGRRDDQVKIRGFRIELGEIEAALVRHALVREAVVAVRRRETDAVDDRYLAGYVTTDGWVDERDLRAHLAELLPGHMIPGFLVVLDALPLNAHGKVDRAALPDPTTMHHAAEYVPPEDGAESAIAKELEATLGLKGVGVLDSFFDVGIDSLAAARLVAAINKRLGATLTVADALSRPTVRELAALVARAPKVTASEPDARDQGTPGDDAGAPFPLSRQQYPIYVEQKKNERSLQYNVPVLVELPADVDLARFEAAWRQVVARHEALRLELRMTDAPAQRVTDRPTPALPVHHAAPRLAALVKPFDLDAGPPWRASLHVDGARRWFFLDQHHLVTDGASLARIFHELDALYRGEALPPVRRQYRDFVRWSEEGEGAELRRGQEPFWAEAFAAPVRRNELPTDERRPARRTNASAMLAFRFGADATRALRAFAAAHGCTLFEALAVGHALFLSSVTGARDVTFGVPATSRAQSGFDDAVGMLANTVCIRVALSPRETVAQLCRRLAGVARASLRNQDFTFRDLTALVQPEMIPGRNPLFDAMFALQGRDLLRTTFLGKPHRLKPLGTGEGMFDLNLQVYEGESDLEAEWEYATELFTADTMEELASTLKRIVRRAVASPHATVAELTAHADSAAAIAPPLDSSPAALFEV